MRRSLVLVLSVFLAVSAAAQEAAMVHPLDGVTVAMVCTDVNRSLRSPGRIHPNVVSSDSPDFAFVIPVAGNAQGANGTWWHSDLSIANLASVAQPIMIVFLRQGVDSGNDPVSSMTLPPDSVTNIDDFIASKLNKTGIGALLISGATSTGGVDSSALLDGFARIWTPQPGSNGTVSQSLSSIPVQDVILDSYALGLKQNSQFRTNVGVVNTSANSRTFNIDINYSGGTASMTMTTPPYSMNQQSITAGNWGNLSIMVGTPLSDIDWWSAYAATVDNVTGDGWSSHAHH